MQNIQNYSLSTLDRVHALWKPDGFEGLYLWIESPELFNQAKVHPSQANYHPFARSHQELFKKLLHLFPSKPSHQEDHLLLLTLPTKVAAGIPQASWENSLSTESLVTAHWQIPAIYVAPSETLTVLTTLMHSQSFYTTASSCKYWATVGSFVELLIQKEAFYPTREHADHKEYTGRWKPLIEKEYALYRDQLATQMPMLCLSFALTAPTSSWLLNRFIEETLNASLKNCLSSLNFTTSISPLIERSESLMHWIPSLMGIPTTFNNPLFSEEEQESSSTTSEFAYQQSITTKEELLKKKELKLLLKLQTPQNLEDTWHLSLFLYALDDPTLMVSAESLWNEPFTFDQYEDPHDRLLKDLVRASDISNLLARCLQEKFPTECLLDTHEAYYFLHQEAPLLIQEGYTIQLPQWLNNARKKVRSQLYLRTTGSSGLITSNTLLEYDWKLSLGEHTLSEKEFKELAALKQPLVQFRGEWIIVDQNELASAHALFKQKEHAVPLIGALQLSWSKEELQTGIPVESVATEKWFEQLSSQLKNPDHLEQIPTPSSFKGTLRPYQQRGLTWLVYLRKNVFGACLADDMGLGKTIQIIALMLHEKQTATETAPYLLICPLSVIATWQQELARFAPSLRVMVHHSSQRLSAEAFKQKALTHDLVITTYTLAVKDYEELLSLEWYSIILDEAHTIKNVTSKQTRAIKALRSRSNIALTGTPLENRLGELWSLMDFLNKGYLGQERIFHKRFTLPIERHNNQEKANLLKNLVYPFMLRRLKTDTSIIQDLPEKIETKERCYLTKEQATLYQSVLATMLSAIEQSTGIERKGLILSTLMKLKQICNHPAQFMNDSSLLEGRSGKCGRLIELLEEIKARNEKSLIFTQFSSMGKLLQKYLTTYYHQEIPFLYGGTPQKTRESLIEQFQKPEGAPLFILSLKAGGTGLTLTEANHVFHFDRWWNPAVEDQATDRAFRIGQKNIVHVHKFICVGTVEERIDALIEQKKSLTNLILTQGEQWLTELSTQELKELFSLSL